MDSNKFDFTAILKLVKSNALLFIIVTIAAIALSVVFSGPTFLKPQFKSYAVVYPINIKEYSEESTTEQLLQMFESNAIRDTLIEKFDLYNSYYIKRGAPSSKYYMNKEYAARVIFSRTQYESVVLEVLDEDPEKAKLMADEVLFQLNVLLQRLSHARGQSRSEAFKRQMDYQLAVIDSIETQISVLSKENHILDFENQTRELVSGYISSLSMGKNSEQAKELKTWLESMEESGSLYLSLQNVSEQAAQEYGFLTKKFLEWRAIGFEEVHYFDVVVSPEVADKKEWPVRWLIVVVSTFCTWLLTLVIVAIRKLT